MGIIEIWRLMIDPEEGKKMGLVYTPRTPESDARVEEHLRNIVGKDPSSRAKMTSTVHADCPNCDNPQLCSSGKKRLHPTYNFCPMCGIEIESIWVETD
tara:strand:- start:12 stop:308 length:297 start_codon:yes stop_codon:yes gene_type:complete